MNLFLKTILTVCIFSFSASAQDWMLNLKSKVELRSWRLTTSALKTERSLNGATIQLYKGNSIIGQTVSDGDGNFAIDIPSKGDFLLVITYPGCNAKKFSVSTNDVPDGVSKDNYKPTVSIGGFLMAKPIKGVDYIGLNEPLLKVEYKAKGQNFDKDEAVTNKGLEIVSKIYDAENTVIEKFCAANRDGDDALKKHNCTLAKDYYTKAIDLIPGESYPVDQMAKVKKCIEDKQSKEDELALQNAKNAEASKQKQDQAKKEKAEKEKSEFTKSVGTYSPQTKAVSTNTVSEPKKESTVIKENSSEDQEMARKSDNKYKMPKVLGANPYKETITKADNYFKTKRYKEAKVAYNDALKIKPGDAYATGKLSDLAKIMGPE